MQDTIEYTHDQGLSNRAVVELAEKRLNEVDQLVRYLECEFAEIKERYDETARKIDETYAERRLLMQIVKEHS